MEYEVILCFFLGGTAVLMGGVLFSLKARGLTGLVVNTLLGAAVLSVLAFCTPLHVPLSPLTALICGFMGVPGVGLCLLILYVL